MVANKALHPEDSLSTGTGKRAKVAEHAKQGVIASEELSAVLISGSPELTWSFSYRLLEDCGTLEEKSSDSRLRDLKEKEKKRETREKHCSLKHVPY